MIETPDSLQSKAIARVLDLVSEGPIGGLVNGLQSVFLDDTPVQNADGSLNFQGCNVAFVPGTQDQDYIAGFPDSESETAVEVEVTNVAPVVRTPSPEGAEVHFVGLQDGATVPQNVTIHFGLGNMGVAPAGIERPNTGHHHLL